MILVTINIDLISGIAYNIYVKQGIYSVSEASRKLGLSEQHIRYLLSKGDIKGKKLGHDWVVLSLKYERKRKPKRTKEQKLT